MGINLNISIFALSVGRNLADRATLQEVQVLKSPNL